MGDKFWKWVASRLPRKLVYWSVLRAWAHATTGRWSHVEVPAVLVVDALNRWEQPAENAEGGES